MFGSPIATPATSRAYKRPVTSPCCWGSDPRVVRAPARAGP